MHHVFPPVATHQYAHNQQRPSRYLGVVDDADLDRVDQYRHVVLVFVERKDNVREEQQSGLLDEAQRRVLGQSVRHEAVAENVANRHDALVARWVRHSDRNSHLTLLLDLRRFCCDVVQLLCVVQRRLFHFHLQRLQRPVQP